MKTKASKSSFETVGLPPPLFWNRTNTTSSITGIFSALASMAYAGDKLNSRSYTVLINLSKISLTVFALNSLYQVYEHVKYEEVVKTILEQKITFFNLIQSVQQRHDHVLESWLQDRLKQPLKNHVQFSRIYLWRDVKFFCLNPQYAGHPVQVNLLKTLINYYKKSQNDSQYSLGY